MQPIHSNFASYVSVGGIRIYGTPSALVTFPEVQSIPKVDYTSEFHLLRHFSVLSNEYKISLVGNLHQSTYRQGNTRIDHEITEDKIVLVLQTIGAKFNQEEPDFKTPRTLVNFVLPYAEAAARHGQLVWIKRKDCRRAYFTIELPCVTGMGGVVSVNDLAKSNLSEVSVTQRNKLRKNSFVCVMPNSLNITTNKITVVIVKYLKDTAPSFSTIYPGELVPPTPKYNQSSDEREYNADYWKDKLFVEAM